MLVSVIIPMYNAEACMPALAGCLASQHCRSFEAVLVDDGSRDGTADAAERALSGAPFPCRVIRRENGGVSAARNTGLAAATGEFVCFADADDAFAPDYLTTLLRGARESGCAVCMAQIRRVQALPDALAPAARKEGETLARDAFLRELLYRGQPYSICSGIYRRSLFENLRFPEGEPYSEDAYTLWRLLLKTEAVCVVREPLYCYLESGDSAMARMRPERIRAVRLMQSLEPYMEKEAPGFAPEFARFAKARHAWSIGWQAAAGFARYADFAAYCAPFPMRESMRAMLRFPGSKERVSAACYLLSPRLYHALARALLPKSKRRERI